MAKPGISKNIRYVIGLCTGICAVIIITLVLVWHYKWRKSRSGDDNNTSIPDTSTLDTSTPGTSTSDTSTSDTSTPGTSTSDTSTSDTSTPGTSTSDTSTHSKDPFDNVPASKVTTSVDPRDFHSLESTDQVRGRTPYGDLVDNGNVISRGLTTVKDLEAHRFTYSMGHPYYDAPYYGVIRGTNWSEYVDLFPVANRLSNLLSNPPTEDSIILIENSGVTIIDMDLKVRGIVVRHGAIVLIRDTTDVKFEIQFILVESGGLLQAGAHGFPYQHNLKIWLTHPLGGYGVMGVVASEYTYEVYMPGTRRTSDLSPDNTNLQTSFMGTAGFGNTFGCKVIAVGFNGNLTLVSQTPQMLPYSGTWSAHDTAGKVWMDATSSLTYLTPKEQAIADLVNVETEYAAVWLPMANRVFFKDKKVIEINGQVPNGWKSGARIMITGKSNQYTTWDDPQGLLPLWVENTDYAENSINTQANIDFVKKFTGTQADKSNGLEVATIDRVEGSKIYLVNPLQFDHDSTYTTIDRKSDNVKLKIKSITVSTALHVGLLTRNISIESKLSNYGTGYNILHGTLPEYVPGSTEWAGPRTTVRCNDVSHGSKGDVYKTCYDGPTNNGRFCNNKPPPIIKNGSWVFGSGTKTGPNSIFAGHTMFRYGSGTHLSGVELTVMGTTGGFGTVARYPLHYHLSGWSDSFSEYLQPVSLVGVGSNKQSFSPITFRRRQAFLNGSIWRSFNHFVNMHGCHEINFKNNVCFISYGNGVFVEDGTELNNTIEHNLLGYSLPCVSDNYYNTIPLMPVVNVDTNCGMAVIWLKNSQNRILRNICCDSPAPTIGIWMAPQFIGYLRGISTVCLGDPIRKLPSLASSSNALGDQSRQTYLSQNKNNWTGVKDELGLDTPCWLPDDIINQDMKTKCMIFTASNDVNPYLLMAENVLYCLFGGISEFPEAVELPGPDYNGTGQFEGAPGSAYNLSSVKWDKKPVFMPFNGQTACTDEFARAPYFETQWAGGHQGDGYPFQPLTKDWISDYEKKGWTRTQGAKANIVPKIFSNFLTHCLGGSTTLWGNAGWTKQGPSWLINSCFLETSKRIREKFDGCFNATCPAGKDGYTCRYTTHGGGGLAVGQPWLSSAFVISSGGDGNNSMYSAIYPVIHNLIVNGGTALPSNPTVLSGSQTFFGDQVILLDTEYNSAKFAAANNTYYCYDLPGTFEEFMPRTVWENRQNLQVQGFVDMTRKRAVKLSTGGRTGNTKGSAPEVVTTFDFSVNKTRKYPYVCGQDNRLFRVGSMTPSRDSWRNIVVNAQAHTFLNDGGIALGDKLCDQLSQIPPCLNNIDNSYNGNMCCMPGSDCN
jgi:hypothetical protein